MFTLKMKLANAAFEEGGGNEIARILREVAADMEDRNLDRAEKSVRDINGNRVGEWKIA